MLIYFYLAVNTSMKQIIEKQNTNEIDTATIEDRRASKGIDIALQRGVTEMIEKVKFFKVDSQSDQHRHYLVKEIHENNKISYACNCKDYENFSIKGETKHECKHIIAVQFAKEYNLTLTEVKSESWRTDEYDF